MASKRSNFSASDSSLNSLTDLKEAALIAIRTPPPPRSVLNFVKPECNISELLIFWFNYVSLTHIVHVSVFGVYRQVLEAKELHKSCQSVVEAETGPGLAD